MNVSFKTKNPLVLYIHGKGGSAAECEHYKPLFPGQEVIGLDYQTSTPWEAEEEIRGEVERQGIFYFPCRRYGTADLRSYGICQCHGGATESGGRNPNRLRRGSVMGLSVLCAGASHKMECPNGDFVWGKR